ARPLLIWQHPPASFPALSATHRQPPPTLVRWPLRSGTSRSRSAPHKRALIRNLLEASAAGKLAPTLITLKTKRSILARLLRGTINTKADDALVILQRLVKFTL